MQVPHYLTKQFSPRKHKYCLCVFVLNEGERIVRQLHKMRPYTSQVDVVIVDGDSSDNVLNAEYLIKMGVSSLLIKKDCGKLGAQLRIGFDYAVRQEYEGVITIDGNDKDDPEAISRFISALDQGYEHVQGSRYIHGGREENTPWLRKLGVRYLHAPLVSLVSGFKYTDSTNGFRAYSRKFLLDSRVSPFRSCFQGYELHYYLAIRAGELGYAVTEVPVTRRYPAQGKVPTKISFFKGNATVLKCLYQTITHRFDPPSSKAIQ